jgi:hypothetical protein
MGKPSAGRKKGEDTGSKAIRSSQWRRVDPQSRNVEPVLCGLSGFGIELLNE